jgi:hypothetical protein
LTRTFGQDDRVADPRDMTETYEETVVVTWDPSDPQTPLDPADLARAMGMHAVVLTAWNPGELRPSLTENQAANRALATRLDAEGCPVWPADGRNPDGSFHEPGFCVWGLPIDRALDIARSFDQYAIYVYRADGVREVAWTAP